MRTITFVAFNRPRYTRLALQALFGCDRLADFDVIVINIDPGSARVLEVCESWAARSPIPVEITVNPTRLGVAANPQRAYLHVFENLSSDLNVAVEDDAVLSPDALALALWFAERYGGEQSPYAFLNLCDHDWYRGTGKNWCGVPEDPALLAESRTLSSPFAWAVSRHQWPFVKRHWNTNTKSIPGWDWSLRFGMRVEGRIALTPVLSRCRNIGQLGGTHDTPETWAAVQLGLNHSDGSYRGDYNIVNRVSDVEARKLSRWMIPELPRILSQHPPEPTPKPTEQPR